MTRSFHGVYFMVMAKREHGNTAVDRGAPVGSTVNPAVVRVDREAVPAPRECLEIAVAIDWKWVGAVLREGDAVGFVVDDGHMEALRDAIANRVGFNVISHSSEPGELTICRPLGDTDYASEGEA